MKLSFSKLIIGGLMLLALCLVNRNTLCELRFKIFSAELSAVMAYEVRQ